MNLSFLQVFIQPFLVDFHLIEVFPNALIRSTTVLPANFWTVMIDGTTTLSSIQVGAIARFGLPDKIWLPQVPLHFTRFNFAH